MEPSSRQHVSWTTLTPLVQRAQTTATSSPVVTLTSHQKDIDAMDRRGDRIKVGEVTVWTPEPIENRLVFLDWPAPRIPRRHPGLPDEGVGRFRTHHTLKMACICLP
jgi:hypothetical protein